ncbi:Ubiquitin system component Cue [Gracilaria domingensis]|nr:Ubiquitin system component Cue [Gracilaria domingensis]
MITLSGAAAAAVAAAVGVAARRGFHSARRLDGGGGDGAFPRTAAAMAHATSHRALRVTAPAAGGGSRQYPRVAFEAVYTAHTSPRPRVAPCNTLCHHAPLDAAVARLHCALALTWCDVPHLLGSAAADDPHARSSFHADKRLSERFLPFTMDSLRAMFPDKDRSALQAALQANNNSVERTVDFLLQGEPAIDPTTRRLQEAHDEALARRLQEEENSLSGHSNYAPQDAQPSQAPFALPSMQDVSNAVRPIVDSVTNAGRVAANHVSQLYNDLVSPPPQTSRPYSRVQDDSLVLRAPHDTSPTARHTARRRAPHSHAASSSSKKDS